MHSNTFEPSHKPEKATSDLSSKKSNILIVKVLRERTFANGKETKTSAFYRNNFWIAR